MAWPCYLVELHPDVALWRMPGGDWTLNWKDLKPGAMWLDDGELCVKLPSNEEWNVDRGRKFNEQNGKRDLPQWTRTGEAPEISAQPSINAVGRYHGSLTKGVLTDDCEGRKFP